jgi:hypothetical protein
MDLFLILVFMLTQATFAALRKMWNNTGEQNTGEAGVATFRLFFLLRSLGMLLQVGQKVFDNIYMGF